MPVQAEIQSSTPPSHPLKGQEDRETRDLIVPAHRLAQHIHGPEKPQDDVAGSPPSNSRERIVPWSKLYTLPYLYMDVYGTGRSKGN